MKTSIDTYQHSYDGFIVFISTDAIHCHYRLNVRKRDLNPI
jgi:hypothetical protein